MSDSDAIIQPHGFTFRLTKKHCPEIEEFSENLQLLADILDDEYENMCVNHGEFIDGLIRDKVKSGYFRDALTKEVGKPYLEWDVCGNRSRYWRMLIVHTYQQFSSRFNRKECMRNIEEMGADTQAEELWDAINDSNVKISPNELRNILSWHKKGTICKEKISRVPIDYSASDSSLIHQEIVGGVINVSLMCVRKDKFAISYPVPPHILDKYSIQKVSKPSFSVNDDGEIVVRITVFTSSPRNGDDNILGVDLGKAKLFSASAIDHSGLYSQELVGSRELQKLKEKVDGIQRNKNSVFDKIKSIECLISGCGGDDIDYDAYNKYQLLSTEYRRLRSKLTRIKDHAAWVVSRDVTAHAKSNNCGSIHVEDLSWLDSTGGKWNHSDTQKKIEHTARSNGIVVHKVDAYGTSWEFPEEYDVNPAPHSSLDSSTRMLISPVSGRKMDKDRTSGIAIACREKKKKGRKSKPKNTCRTIQPRKCRDKHHSTPKRPKNTKKKIVINEPIPHYASVSVDAVVEGELFSQAAKNTSNQTCVDCPLMSRRL